MTYTFTEKKRIRNDFGKRSSILEVPFLLATQLDSYRDFLQAGIPPHERRRIGLQAAFESVFPIESYSGDAKLEFLEYRLEDPLFDVKECQVRGLTYAAALRVRLRLALLDKEGTSKERSVRDLREQEVYMGEIPLMTDSGTLVINRHRAGHRVPAPPLAGGVLRARQGQDPFLGGSCCSRPG